MTYLLVTLAIAATTPGVITAVRALPWVQKRVELGVKPWACNICSTFWTTALVAEISAIVMRDWHVLFLAGPAYTISLVVLERLVEAPPGGGPPPELPLH